jgi:hypothetical protein
VLGAVFVFLDLLVDGEVGLLKAHVGDGVGAEVMVRLRLRGSVAPAIAIGAVLGNFLLDCHDEGLRRERNG